MDTQFQTSFIPKKPILADQKVTQHSGGGSIFSFIAIIIFILSVAAAVFSFIWKDILIKQQDSYRVELKKAETRFNVALIDKLKKADTKLGLTVKLLKKHQAVSEVFSIINLLTADGIRFNTFEFTSPESDKDSIKITMKGAANSFSAIAWQSDVFGQSSKFGKNKVLKNPIISDLVLDKDGNVNFSFNASLVTNDILYEKLLTAKSDNVTNP